MYIFFSDFYQEIIFYKVYLYTDSSAKIIILLQQIILLALSCSCNNYTSYKKIIPSKNSQEKLKNSFLFHKHFVFSI